MSYATKIIYQLVGKILEPIVKGGLPMESDSIIRYEDFLKITCLEEYNEFCKKYDIKLENWEELEKYFNRSGKEDEI